MCFLLPVTATKLSDRLSAERSYVDWLGSLQCLLLSLRLANQRGVRTDHHNDVRLGRTEP